MSPKLSKFQNFKKNFKDALLKYIVVKFHNFTWSINHSITVSNWKWGRWKLGWVYMKLWSTCVWFADDSQSIAIIYLMKYVFKQDICKFIVIYQTTTCAFAKLMQTHPSPAPFPPHSNTGIVIFPCRDFGCWIMQGTVH